MMLRWQHGTYRKSLCDGSVYEGARCVSSEWLTRVGGKDVMTEFS